MNILLVDDDEVDVMTVQRAFRRNALDHELHVCNTGVDALEYLQRASELPDVVLLDINMPRMGGLELLKRVRADPRLAPLYVVVLTTSRADYDVRAAHGLNAAGYIVKPVSFQSFVAMV